MTFNWHGLLQAFAIGFGQVVTGWEFVPEPWHATVFFGQGCLQAGLGLAGHRFTPKGRKLAHQD